MARKDYFDLESKRTPLRLRVFPMPFKHGRVSLVQRSGGTPKRHLGKRESSHSKRMRVAACRWYGAWLTIREIP